MPLHLLSKKSWNVYAPDNIARVKRDEAEAQAREAEEDRRTQEQDAAQRLALLRGEHVHVELDSKVRPVVPAPGRRRERETHEHGHEHGDDRRKRRRLQGEDDTDRDLRLAREELDSKHRRHHLQAPSEKRHEKAHHHVPIIDHNGHTNLFPVDSEPRKSTHKNVSKDVQQAQKQQREFQEEPTMRFSDAGGRNAPKAGPWYAASRRQQREDMEVIEGKDVWGRPDPSAKSREAARQTSNDPFALMQRAQTQLKQAEKDKKQWQQEEQNDHGQPHWRSSDHLREGSEHRPRHRKGDDKDKAKRRGHDSYKRHRDGTANNSEWQQALANSSTTDHYKRLPTVPDDLDINA